MNIRKNLKVLVFSLVLSLPLGIINAEEFDVQGTMLKAQNNDKQALYDLGVLKHEGRYGV